MHICSGGKQETHVLGIFRTSRVHQACPAILIDSMHIRSSGKQETHVLDIFRTSRVHQTCPAILINGVHISSGGKQHPYNFCITLCRSVYNIHTGRISPPCYFRCIFCSRVHQTCQAILINGVHISSGGKQRFHKLLVTTGSSQNKPVRTFLLECLGLHQSIHNIGTNACIIIQDLRQAAIALLINRCGICTGSQQNSYAFRMMTKSCLHHAGIAQIITSIDICPGKQEHLRDLAMTCLHCLRQAVVSITVNSVQISTCLQQQFY